MSSSDEIDICATPPKKRKLNDQPKRNHRVQKYRQAWENDPNFKHWLGPVKNNPLKAYCKLCDAEISAEITVIKRHRECEKHKRLSAEVGYGSNQRTLFQCLNKRTIDPLQQQIKVAEIRTSAFIAENNLSLRCADFLVKRDQAIYPDSKIAQGISLGRTKATKIVQNVIGQSHSDELAERLKHQKFSVIVDESTDIGTVKTLAICVRLFSTEKQKVEDCFWKLAQIFCSNNFEAANAGATAERLFEELIQTFNKAAVPIENMIGFGADNCSTMIGVNNSVASRLKEVAPGIIIQGCVCHSLHLCASEACKMLPRKPEDLARQIYACFKNSSKRQAQLQEYQEFCNVEPHKILKPSQTRWLSLLQVVQRILEQWDALKLFFTFHQSDARCSNLTVADKTTSLDLIVDAMNDPQVKIYFLFLDWCLPKIIKINELFQSERSLITSIHKEVTTAYKDLLSCFMERDYILKSDISRINPELTENNAATFLNLHNIYLGIKVTNEFKKENVIQHQKLEPEVRLRCRNFLSKICSELKKRFDMSNESPFSKLAVLHPSEVLSKASTRKESLLPLAEIVPRIVSADDFVTLQKIDDQWRLIAVTNFPEISATDTAEKVWQHIKNSKNINGQNEFAEVATFALNVLCLPHSSASCERVFSKINLMKTKIRNKLATDTINGLLLSSQCATSGGGSHNFPVTEKMMSRMTSSLLYTSKDITVEEDDIEIEFETIQ